MTPKERRKAKKAIRKKKREERRKLRLERRNVVPEVGGAVRFVTGLATSLKRVGIQYTEDYGTTLPGYMDSTRVLGSNLKSGQPGFGFTFLGQQLDTSWINDFGTKGLLSTDTMLSAMIQQRYNQRLNITAQLSPLRDLNIDVNFDKTFDKQYSELYKDTSKVDNVGLTRLNPYALGSFSISYISYQTLFKEFDRMLFLKHSNNLKRTGCCCRSGWERKILTRAVLSVRTDIMKDMDAMPRMW